MNWFDVDKEGLAKLLARKGPEFALFELIQNAWDTDAKNVTVEMEPLPNMPYSLLIVEDDDPEGFKNLTHAFTLFAESEKKGDVAKRGRFNLGEKMVLALCSSAEIETTKGSVLFTKENGRRNSSKKRSFGSRFKGTIRLARDEHARALAAVQTLLPPDHIRTTINGVVLEPRPPVLEFQAALATEIADAEGYLRKSERTTQVTLHQRNPNENAMLYEMGIPVVELPGQRWHVNVQQKVPLNSDRDNVTPAYARQLSVAVLNAAHHLLDQSDATRGWVREAAGDERAVPDAVERTISLRFGEKRVAFDPSDPEGTKLAVSQGYTVISGGSLSAGEWDNVRRDKLALPAGQVTPSPKPYSSDGDPEKIIPVEKWTPEMGTFAERAGFLGWELMGVKVTTRFVKEPGVYWRATYGRGGSLAINVGKVGRSWFEGTRSNRLDHLSLLLHEFGHEYSGDHLSEEYHRALCRLGAKLAFLAAAPGWNGRMGLP